MSWYKKDYRSPSGPSLPKEYRKGQGTTLTKQYRKSHGTSPPKRGLAPKPPRHKPWMDKLPPEEEREREWCQLEHDLKYWAGHALYPLVKYQMIDLWSGRCALCNTWFVVPPDLHHLALPKNAGVTISSWWNCVPLCQACHQRAHGDSRETLLQRLYERIGKRTCRDGKEFIAERIEDLRRKGILT